MSINMNNIHIHYVYAYLCNLCVTAILLMIEGRETAFNGSKYQFTTGESLKNLKLTLDYYENGCKAFIISSLQHNSATSCTFCV
jgi:hypothetical protein